MMRRSFLILVITAVSLAVPPANASKGWKDHPMNYKLHAYNLLLDFDEFQCLVELYEKESNWRPSARNGSHNGIPQGRSKWLATVDGFKQVEWGIKYNHNRYGSMCKALRFFKKNGYH
jgi:hypothetical protein